MGMNKIRFFTYVFSLLLGSQVYASTYEDDLLCSQLLQQPRYSQSIYAQSCKNKLNQRINQFKKQFEFNRASLILPDGIVELNSSEIDSDIKDLEPILNLAKKAKVIGIGESAHTVKEYTQLRSKIARALVEKYGFKLLTIESEFYTTESLNKYLQSCINKPGGDQQIYAGLQNSLAIIYRSQAFKKEIDWLCRWNKAHPKKTVAVHGIDIWDLPWVARNFLNNFQLKIAHADFNKNYLKAYNNCWLWAVNSYEEAESTYEWTYILENWRLDPVRMNACQGALYNMQMIMDKNKSAFVGMTSSDDYFIADQLIGIQWTFQTVRDYMIVDMPKSLQARDERQAANVLAWMSKYQLKNKTAFFAHNLHVSKAQSLVVTQNPGSNQWKDARSAGEYLWHHFGGEYFSIGLTGYNLTSTWDGGTFPLPQSIHSLDLKLSKLGKPLLAMSVHIPLIESRPYWWMQLEMEPEGVWLKPKEQYDALIFVKDSVADDKW